MKIKISAPYLLEKANSTDVGYDLRSVEEVTFEPGQFKLVNTGLRILTTDIERPNYLVETPRVFALGQEPANPVVPLVDIKRIKAGIDIQLRGRSSMAVKGFMTHVGTIDETYQSDIKVVLFYWGEASYTINPGDKIAQLVFAQFTQCDIQNVTAEEAFPENRGGFGSSGT